MKHFWGSIIVALCLCVGVAHAANDYNLTPEIASAYFEVVDGLAEQDYMFLMQTGCSWRPAGYEYHFWDARLVDFDGDTVPELFLIHDFGDNIIINQNRRSDSLQFEVWGWNGREAYQIKKGKTFYQFGTLAPCSMELKGILYEDGRAYVPFMAVSYGACGVDSGIFYTVKDGEWVSAPEKYMYAEDNWETSDPRFLNVKINGKPATSEQYVQRCNEIYSNLIDVWHVCDYDADGKWQLDSKYKQFVNEVNMPLTVTSSVDTVQIDGNPVPLQFYNVGGYNYVRMRDFAAALKDTNAPFDVQWKYGWILFIKDMPYSGQTNAAKVQTNVVQHAAPEIRFLTKEQYQDLIREGHFVARQCDSFVRALNINDENYIKLRDISMLAGCFIDWDSATGTVIIDTSREYSE